MNSAAAQQLYLQEPQRTYRGLLNHGQRYVALRKKQFLVAADTLDLLRLRLRGERWDEICELEPVDRPGRTPRLHVKTVPIEVSGSPSDG